MNNRVALVNDNFSMRAEIQNTNASSAIINAQMANLLP